MQVESLGEAFPYLGVAQAKCALNVGIELREDGWTGSFVFDADRLARSSVESMVEGFERFVREVVTEPEQPLRARDSRDRQPLEDENGSSARYVTSRPELLDVEAVSRPGEERGDLSDVEIAASQPMYVMYTSGTTGRPKGVVVPHRAVTNHVRWLETAYGMGTEDVILLKSSYGFDMSVSEIWAPMATGATIGIAAPGAQRDPNALIEAVERFGVTCLRVVPTALNVMLAETGVEFLESELRWIMLG
ncbi:MAG: AMP-binding protein, partial [Bradymonadaceae bacterium]